MGKWIKAQQITKAVSKKTHDFKMDLGKGIKDFQDDSKAYK
jgi:hypothetical protein